MTERLFIMENNWIITNIKRLHLAFFIAAVKLHLDSHVTI